MPIYTNSGDKVATSADDTFIYDVPRPRFTTVDAAGGSDTLIVEFDPATTGPVNIDIGDDSVGYWNADIRANTNIPIYALNFEHAELHGTNSDDAFRLEISQTSFNLTVMMDAGAGEDRLRLYWNSLTTDFSFVVDGANVTSTFGTFLNFESYYIFGGAGNDVITTGDGDDAIYPGSGIDHISTGGGNDAVEAQSSGGSIDLGEGDDYLTLYVVGNSTQFTSLNGGAGQDRLYISWHDSSIGQSLIQQGSTITSTLGPISSFESFIITGGSGDDVIATGLADDHIWTGAGNDSVQAGGGVDYINVGAGNDTVDSGEGNDTAYAGLGDDVVLGGDGHDSIFGDDSQVSSVGDGDDQLDGEGGSDSIYGGGGDDDISGGTGNDYLVGGQGSDQLDGGDGNDSLLGFGETSYGEIDDFRSDSLTGGAGDDRLYTGFGDSADGGTGIDSLDFTAYGANVGITADFSILTNGGTISVGGGIFSGIEYVTRISGTDFSDNLTAGAVSGIDGPTIYGWGGADKLTGGAADDWIYGGDGDDTILGAAGDDRLRGENGNDSLAGGSGFDTYTGGAGTDTFVGTAAELNGDQITDFSVNDKIIITDATLASFSFNVSGNMLTYSGGTIYLGSAVTGNFEVSAAANGGVEISVHLPPVGTVDQIANQLSSGYWNGSVHHFDVSQSRTITVDITDLNAAEQVLARAALAQWSDVIGVQFQEVATNGQITFDTSEAIGGPIAETDTNWTSGTIQSAVVHISTSWVTENGSSIDSYSFQTYLHEIGHALGLGHPGDYNTSADFPADANFLNDSWALSVMSYFDQRQSSYFEQLGFSVAHVVSPMQADIIAAQNLYGLSTSTRTGDTIYGFNSNAGVIYDAQQYPSVAYTVFDSGGNDTLDFSGSTSAQLINLNAGTFSNVNGMIGNLAIARGTLIENVIGGGSRDVLIGNSADNILDGGEGADEMAGGLGNDAYFVNVSPDSVIEEAGFGTDTVIASVGYSLPANVENLTLLGLSNIVGFGNSSANSIDGNAGGNALEGLGGNDRLSGHAGSDILTGGAGADLLDGGADDDLYMIMAASEHAGAEIDDTGTNGTDEVRFAATAASTLTLFAADRGIERVVIGTGTGANASNGGTTALNVNAAAVNNALVMTGNNGANALTGTAFNDSLSGLGGDDILKGGASNDLLTGGTGLDKMYGGVGDDTYVVSDATDYVFENAGEGTDTVLSSISLTLRDHLEVLTLTGAGNIFGRGNGEANVITGNGGANKLYGLDGSDTLYGGSGNDLLDGGLSGADLMYGGTGNDVFYVRDGTDKVVELLNQGTDLVYTNLSYWLTANVENLTLTGSGNVIGRGNGLNNLINGNDGTNKLFGYDGDDRLYGRGGNDVIDGGSGGVDRMWGGEGNDTYYVHDATDYAFEYVGQGTDIVYSDVSLILRANIENLVLTGTADLYGKGNGEANVITGNAGANKLLGLGGNDRLDGGAGNDLIDGGVGQDVVSGGAGADLFVFGEGDFGGASAATADRILDFAQADGDRIRLSTVDANTILAGDQAFAFIGTGAFSHTAGELRYQQIGANTFLMGDTNGDGTAEFWIRFDGLHTLTKGDFLL